MLFTPIAARQNCVWSIQIIKLIGFAPGSRDAVESVRLDGGDERTGGGR
jgi:hypothetical protein